MLLSQAFLCMLVQLVVPLLVGMHSMMQILTPEDQSAIEWENVCWGRTEWEVANILTKVVGSILLLYMYNYLVAKQSE